MEIDCIAAVICNAAQFRFLLPVTMRRSDIISFACATSFSRELIRFAKFFRIKCLSERESERARVSQRCMLVYRAQRYPITETTRLFSSVEVLQMHREVLEISL